MRKRWLINLLLLAVVAGLSLFIFFRPPQKQPGITRLTAITPSSIHTIRIKRANNKTLVLKKIDHDWQLTAPLLARSNARNVARVRQIGSAPTRQVVTRQARGRDFAKFGLDKPRAILWLNDTEIRFGAIHPLNNLQYVGVGDKVYLLSLHHFHVIANPLAALLSPQLLAARQRPIAFRFPGHRLWLAKGRWQLRPPRKKTGQVTPEQHAQAWRQATALSVKPYSGKAAIDRITVTVVDAKTGKHSTLKIDVLSYRPSFILHRRDEGLEYRFPARVSRWLIP